jgi:hypothetical protein
MKKLTLLFYLITGQFSFGQNQVVVSLISEYENQILTLASDTLQASVYYNLTGYESVSSVVMNVITIFNDKTQSRKEFNVISYSYNEDENTTDITVKTEDGNIRYLFFMKKDIVITQSKRGNFLWTGDVIF